MDYEEYEKQCKKIQKENEKYLDLFEQDLEQQGLSEYYNSSEPPF